MNRVEADRWTSAVLDEIFVALAASQTLQECLVFKGARVLNILLGSRRQSLDIDSNLIPQFVQRLPDRARNKISCNRRWFRPSTSTSSSKIRCAANCRA